MRYLTRVYAPTGGLVLDPFMGSGSTGIASLQEGRRFVGIDMTQHYVDISQRRIQDHCFSEEPKEKLFEYE
jgi:site-specific DNA-methyltransferase (adenine-specific)